MSFKRWLRQWLNRDEELNKIVCSDISPGSDPLDGTPLRMHVYHASGGIVINTIKWDHRAGTNKSNMYAITSDKDLGEELSKIITLNAL